VYLAVVEGARNRLKGEEHASKISILGKVKKKWGNRAIANLLREGTAGAVDGVRGQGKRGVKRSCPKLSRVVRGRSVR